ncbi:NupC/NupG family nucleoside CNT transporter [Weissella paramesenteroides]|jgi:purine nucleoside transport protein|uniref:NupC/NupG family nucleoside CNT transporter n=1 Tax=Weissella paramesenteroides TaxID=1249 RepID=UPI001125CF92|nr:nucleoside transporter C-terminal domain-containing protein [Weissella paramesenteroides]KAA8442072.1 NupC/NupG family nucleoside CNT transporter [Weissella paramesenteroides]KAA8442316.1 NupC/NupG family nucleoside CNT transporter [Weissella paramesenteroides]KAA8443710.1 NupC/NupG family nucleoside CNT transporter [Weissella paramesenteroides]KAA8447211.1 NupC/NupG family nucleoside CNT transporter [Weissella paramesenteroides]KAA8450124.1 NupC/NupG family nucleoside CNT transporter [Weis
MLIAINVLGILVFVGVAYLFSNDKKNIQWKSVSIVLVLEVFLAWFFTQFKAGQIAVQGAADGFNWLVSVASKGIAFALPDWLTANNGGPNFVTSALLPILLVVPLFDILTYFGILPWIIKWIGKALTFITGQPKFEAFFSIEMMFLGNTEVLAVSKNQLESMSARRNFTLAMMSMSCVTSAIIGSYTQMVPGQYVLTAVPLNILGAIVISAILNPTKVAPEDDVIVKVDSENGKKEPFFSFLGDSILGAGKLILIITATVIAFVALAALIDQLFSLTGFHWLTLENIFGVIMFPFAWLLGFNAQDAFHIAQFMGTKLVTNEFVVMGEISKSIMANKGLFSSEHARIVMTVFLTSFANFGTIGMILGAFKGLVNKEKNEYISSRVGYMLLSGVLVSLLSAATAGMFVW